MGAVLLALAALPPGAVRAAEGIPGGTGSSVVALSARHSPARPSINLPESVLGWVRPDTVRKVRPDALFDYMDGGAELYLSYRFRHLEVIEYSREDEDLILLELYLMEEPDDAYGLLSLDWSGEVVPVSASAAGAGSETVRALYAGGLLRLWAGDIFARIMAYNETDRSREAVFEMARSIAGEKPFASPPAEVMEFPHDLPGGYALTSPLPSFFRTHLALNAVYLISPDDVLDLGHSGARGVIGAFARAGADAPPYYLLRVRYADEDRAGRAFKGFRASYLIGDSGDAAPVAGTGRALAQKGRIWCGAELHGAEIIIAAECPDEAAVERFLSAAGVSGEERLQGAQ